MVSICPGREAGYRPDGACGFPVDPAQDALEADVFWRPEIAPAAVVLLGPRASSSSDPVRFEVAPASVRHAEEGVHVRLAGGPQLLLLDDARMDAPMSVVIPFDGAFAVRVAAAQALWERVGEGRDPPDILTGQRRWRLRRMLRAVDARDLGASYRDVADRVLGEPFADSMSWRTSSARDVAIRLCRSAGKLVRDGYLALLRRRG
jgi:hypothetical protein